MKLSEIKNRCLDKIHFGRPFKAKLPTSPIPHLCPPVGVERLKRGMAAFDADREELERWSFILETSFGCFKLKIIDIEILIDQIKFDLQTLTARYRLDLTVSKLHIFDAKGQIFAIKPCGFGVFDRNETYKLWYKIFA